MIDRSKLSQTIREVIVVTEAECGTMSEDNIELLIRKEKGEITTEDIVRDIKKKYGVK